MSPNLIEQKIKQNIALNGAISVAEFISLTMSDTENGYYANSQAFGRHGDFITAPEISQLFGEMLAFWVIATWETLGKPKKFTLCEAGAGCGTLMDDILRTISKVEPNCFDSINIMLIEVSPLLRSQQKEKIKKYNKPITWFKNYTETATHITQKMPNAPVIFIANEFLDVLPIHQYQKSEKGWHERVVTVNDKDQLYFALGLAQPLPSFINDEKLTNLCHDAPIDAIIETSPIRQSLVQNISMLIAQHKGAALFIDYGALQHGFGDTLQAVSKHQFSAILDNIGTSDISSHVNFASLLSSVKTANCQASTTTQGEFLLNLGLLERAGRLGAGKDEAMQQQIRSDVERLAAPQEMGDLFKVLCISDSNTNMPPFKW